MYCKLISLLLLLIISSPAIAQARLVMNGGVITIANGASLVIDNTASAAITYNGTGYIQSEGENNRIVWTIGAGNGNAYLLPFGNASGYFPLQFNAASGTGAGGQFVFSTYAIASWKNSDYLPAGVTNINRGTTDNSANVIDRFWQLTPQGYTANPSLSNLVFTYAEPEFAAPNTIIEANLGAQRWNTALQKWDDYIPASFVSTVSNTVTVAAIAGNQLYNWWTLADMLTALPVTLTYFRATPGNAVVLTTWQTALEQNSDHFEVWRSKDGQLFEYAGRARAAGNSSVINNYSFTDVQPYSGTSYYRLKSIDKDAAFTWSAIVSVTLGSSTGFFLFPNPAHDFISIGSNNQLLNNKPVASLYDATGKLLQTIVLSNTRQTVNTAALAAGIYQIIIHYNNQTETLRFIKK